MAVALGAALMLPAAVLGQACTAPIPAGTCTASTSTTLTVGRVIQLTLSSTTTTLAPPALSDYDAGFVANQGPSATVKSNGRWKLQISAAAPTWDAADGAARTDKPASDLQWSTLPSGQYTSVATTPSDVAEGGATAGTPLPLHYRAQLDQATDAPGSYTLVVKLTLVGA